VPIHSQIDGTSLGFYRGPAREDGDLLAKIDPRPFQAGFDQAVAKKAQNQANLISAEKDLTRAKTLVVRSFETQAKVDALTASSDHDTRLEIRGLLDDAERSEAGVGQP
jgi:membrane fusion protein, multidrug efflux system